MKPLFLLFLLIPLHLVADEKDEGDSPSGKIHFRVSGKEGDESREIWLWPKGQKENAVKLCDTEGWGYLEIHFSSDDYWIIVQDGGASLGVNLTLFRRAKQVTFKEIQDADIGDKAEHLALTKAGMPKDYSLDHRYMRVVYWTDDSRFVLVTMHGGGSNQGKLPVGIGGWYGLYDLGTGHFTFDLNKVNEGSVEKPSK